MPRMKLPAAPPRLDDLFCFPLYAASNLVTRIYGPLLTPLKLTYPQYLVMLVLWETQTLTVRALGQRLLLESGTLSPLLRRLELRKLIKKQVDPDDARRVLVSLTPKGRALGADVARVPETLLCRLLERGGDGAVNEVVAMRDQLKRLLAAWSVDEPLPAQEHR
jgi:MarR family transcriptional regulator, organic hydroperoxide resistance regulator